MTAMIILGIGANQMSPQMAALCLGAFALVFLLAGIALGINSIRNFKLAQASTGWPSTIGKITSAIVNVESRSEKVKDSNARHSYRTRIKRTYTPNIQFSYSIGGENYRSDQRVIGGKEGFSSSNAADAVIEKYPVGKEVNVYYDPADPKAAVLEPGVSGALVPWAVAGVAFVLVGVGISWMMVQMLVSA